MRWGTVYNFQVQSLFSGVVYQKLLKSIDFLLSYSKIKRGIDFLYTLYMPQNTFILHEGSTHMETVSQTTAGRQINYKKCACVHRPT